MRVRNAEPSYFLSCFLPFVFLVLMANLFNCNLCFWIFSGWLLSGKSRSDLNLNDFEQLTKIFAYNENGGFQHSEVIQHNVIDHYIPFLPLEKDHVIKCIENEYNYAKQRNYQVSSMVSFDDLKESVLGGMTFIPPEYIFSSSGCKRVKSKVGTYLSRLGIYY